MSNAVKMLTPEVDSVVFDAATLPPIMLLLMLILMLFQNLNRNLTEIIE